MSFHSQIINTFAGNGVGNFSGDGGPATAAELFYSGYIAFDTASDLYITDFANARVRKVNTSGIITTVAGNGSISYAGDGGPATAAEFNQLAGITLDAAGNLYICDEYHYVLRKVNTAGIINAFAGNYAYGFGYSGDGGPATAAELYFPAALAFDVKGNGYISDIGASLIRRVDTAGIITTFAGNYSLGRGYSGDGGPATAAELYAPADVAFDTHGSLYIADANNHVVRKVNTSGIISTFAGDFAKGGGYSGDGGYATMAELNSPVGLKMDTSGNLYIADQGENVIRMVNNLGIITTVAGNHAEGAGYSGDGGPATAAELNAPTGVALDKTQKLYIGDMENNRVRVLAPVITEINEVKGENGKVNVYPDPGTSLFTVTGLAPGQVIDVYNYTGQKILSAISNGLWTTINISNLANGIYLLRILNRDGTVVTTKKVLKTY